ncbi:HTH_Tnp_Tc3_2 domain-containing protein [Trichonephila clavipes]|uniref:HTH_Tnp_Tc3_2 domain-containing protein n=1 Tax=Trichonephila clavipes TaxID=2585209 RepID=A0A8X7BAA9_TRICX|nr:HTH_Tnp_Tc3_2 domain-containing protein [Trichonephila clavipes]
MTVYRRLIERNLRSYRPLRHLSLTPAHCQTTLRWFLVRSGWNHDDWRRIVFRKESCLQLCPDDNRSRVSRRPGFSNTSLASQITRFLSSRACLGRRLPLLGNADFLIWQLEKIGQEIPQETDTGLYHSVPRRVTAVIQARVGSTLC